MEGEPVPEFPSSYFFRKTKLLLTVYVDDFTLSGPSEHHPEFWRRLRQDVELEAETGLERILGRFHEEVTLENRAYLAFNMEEDAQQACKLYSTVQEASP